MAALNLQTNDEATQLHHALFELAGGKGYVKKPKEMLMPVPTWPPDRTMLRRVTMTLISLHHLPTRSERRPRRHGEKAKVHDFVSALSGEPAPTR